MHAVSEEMLIKISYFFAILGLVVLYFYVENVELESVTTLDGVEEDKLVRIIGKVGRVEQQENAMFLEIQGVQEIVTDAILFPEKEIALQEGANVEVKGRVEEYNGKKELVVEKVTVLG